MKRALILMTLLLPGLIVFAQESTASDNVSSFTLYSPQLKTNRKIWVYLPHGYTTSTKKFPVIYMHDGQNLFDKKTAAFGEWKIDETLDSLAAGVIVIGIEHGNDKRINELTPYKNEKHGGGSGELYLDFIINTVKPYVDKNYRTKASCKNTAIGGSSLGGLFSFYAALKHPDIFGKAIIFSPAFWINPEIFTLAENYNTIKSKIYFMAGDSEDEDMLPDMERVVKALTQKRKNTKNIRVKTVAGGRHNEALWAREFGEAFLWLVH